MGKKRGATTVATVRLAHTYDKGKGDRAKGVTEVETISLAFTYGKNQDRHFGFDNHKRGRTRRGA